ncbi:MAG: hypothetical protein HY676_03800 [Chloroflexi bacterium]|nr:hypothetical protein [Chloroflexota bacterium]
MNPAEVAAPGKGEARSILCYLDLDWQESQGRSLDILLEGRLCESCRSRRSRPRRKGSSASKKTRVEELRAQIQSCCSRKDDFITPRTPLLEAAFRLLLSREMPLSLEEMVRELSRRRRSYFTEELMRERLERMLARDTFYGFRLQSQEPPNA